MPLARTLRVTAALGEQGRHRLRVVAGFVTELLGEGVVDVDVGELVGIEAVGRPDLEQRGHQTDDLVHGLDGPDVVARGDHRQGLHVGPEEVDLAGAEIPPVDPVALGTLEQRVVDVGDVLDVVHPVPVVEQLPDDQVEGHVGGGVAEMGGVVGRDATDVDPHLLTGTAVLRDPDGQDAVVSGVVESQGYTVSSENGHLGNGP